MKFILHKEEVMVKNIPYLSAGTEESLRHLNGLILARSKSNTITD
jgi:hypothetical protein